MKIQRMSLVGVFSFLILVAGSLQAAEYRCPVSNLSATDQQRSSRTIRDFTPIKKSFSELPTTINGTLWPTRSSLEQRVSLTDVDPLVVEVNSNITTNTIWQESNIYHVTADIQVQALLVIEPGTTITFAENARIRVNTGGCLIACGTPEKIIQFLPDATIEQYVGAFFAISIEATASPATQVRYCFFKQAYTGIFTGNIRLDTAIHHNYFNSCVYGVAEQGIQLTDVFNNQFYMSYEVAIYVDVVSSDEQESSASEILIQNNTCNFVQYYAIAIFGANAEANKGRIQIVNNILSNAYCGIYWDYYAWLYPANNGYYNNYANQNFTYEEPGSVEMTAGAESPFETGTGDFDRAFLKQSCPLIDAGCIGINMDEETVGSFTVQDGDVSQIPQILGFTTALNDDCDLGRVDLGFHSPNFDKVNVGEYATYLISDLNQDGTVNEADLTILRNHYGQVGSWSEGDINGDGIVDAYDLGILRKLWGQDGYVHLDIDVNIAGNINDLKGLISLNVSGYNSEDVYKLCIFIDGYYFGELKSQDGNNYNIIIDTALFMNGYRSIKLISMNSHQMITLGHNFQVFFNNQIYSLMYPKYFEKNKSFRILGFSSIPVENLSITLTDINDNLIVDGNGNSLLISSCAGNSFDIFIESAASLDNWLYRLNITETAKNAGYHRFFIFPRAYTQGSEIYPVGALVTVDEHFWASNSDAVMTAIRVLHAYCPNMVLLWNTDASSDSIFNLKILGNFEYLMKNALNLNIQYWYHYGHGIYYDRTGYDFWVSSPRTNITIGNYTVFSFLRSDFGETPPDWYQNIDSDKVPSKSILSLTKPFISLNRSQFKIVFIDTCWSGFLGSLYYPGLPTYDINDMAWALGMYNDDPVYGDVLSAYLGWASLRFLPIFDPSGLNPYDDNFVADFWEDLGHGSSVESAWFNNGRQPGSGSTELWQISRCFIYNSSGDAQGIFLWPIP